MDFQTTVRWLALLILLPALAHAQDDPDARELLRALSKASASQSYSGVLTYEYGAHLASLAVEQQVSEQGRDERLLHLNGQLRGIQRHQGFCNSPSEELLQGLNGKQALEDYYYVSLIGHERVAGRLGYVLQVMPKDQYRYGYVITLDKTDYLPLKILLVGAGNKVLERFQFVQINATGSVSESPTKACQRSQEKSRWSAAWLPEGFEFVGVKQSQMHEMLMYTDGMAAFSVFIEPVSAQATIEGRAQRGATVAFLGSLKSDDKLYRVTAVGEAPITTLERVALSMVERGR